MPSDLGSGSSANSSGSSTLSNSAKAPTRFFLHLPLMLVALLIIQVLKDENILNNAYLC